jgi:glycosyltransferase involved in cell wall biosynthesis
MEGAAMGKPLLASNARGCREIVRPPRNGVLARLRDAESLAAAMVEMAGDPKQREAWGKQNALEAQERYDVRRSVEKVIAVYEQLLAERSAGTLRRHFSR